MCIIYFCIFISNSSSICSRLSCSTQTTPRRKPRSRMRAEYRLEPSLATNDNDIDAANKARQRGAAKVARIPLKVEPTVQPLRKPNWIRAKAPTSPEVARMKSLLREHRLHTVYKETTKPKHSKSNGHGTATFMIMGDIC